MHIANTFLPVKVSLQKCNGWNLLIFPLIDWFQGLVGLTRQANSFSLNNMVKFNAHNVKCFITFITCRTHCWSFRWIVLRLSCCIDLTVEAYNDSPIEALVPNFALDGSIVLVSLLFSLFHELLALISVQPEMWNQDCCLLCKFFSNFSFSHATVEFPA